MTKEEILNQKNEKIWHSYKQFKEMSNVPRSGFRLFGIIEFPDSRCESVLEHTAGTVFLATILSEHYPELRIGVSEVLFMLTHDVPETILGDIPDDGDRDAVLKKTEENLAYKNFIQLLPKDLALKFAMIFLNFEERKIPIAKVLYYIDKIEAIFQCLVYEKKGLLGNIDCKPELSNQDRKLVDLTDSKNLSDLFLAGFLYNNLDLIYPEIFINLVKVAWSDLGKEWPEWAKDLGF